MLFRSKVTITHTVKLDTYEGKPSAQPRNMTREQVAAGVAAFKQEQSGGVPF